MIKLALLIPDRGDRPEFLANCLRMMKGQTYQADHIEIVNYEVLSPERDITQRYRIGYEALSNGMFDLIAFIENDDWYAPDYLETMVNKWVSSGKPDLLGTQYTIYYHIKMFAWFTMEHVHRSSAMNTCIKPDLNFEWCEDNEPYTDIHLWTKLPQLSMIYFTPDKHLSLGIKHGVGMCGGGSHTTNLPRYINPDNNKEFIKNLMDPESFEFYSKYFENKKV